jgi:CubicO group peptidase (beta-lactamase class C family)
MMCVSVADSQALPMASPSDVGLSAERLGRIETLFQGLVDSGELAGVTVLVGRRGRVAYFKTLGYMDVEAHRPMARDAIFRIASMTKAVTAVAVLQLFEQGRFVLDDPVSRFLPVFKDARVLDPNQAGADPNAPRTVALAREITIRDLLRHTSGIIYRCRRYTKAGLRKWDKSLAEFVETLAGVPLDCQPGTKFRYSYSTDVLGRLVEVVSGQDLDAYFSEHIFSPLRMADTGFVVPTHKVERLTNHYRFKDGRLICEEQAATSPFLKRAQPLSGGGGWGYNYPGLVSTAQDWWRFLEMLRNHGQLEGKRLLSRKTVELMCTDHLSDIPYAPGPGNGYGLAVGVVTDSARHGQSASTGTIYWSGGPHNTYYFVDFKEQMTGIMFLQTENRTLGHENLRRKFLVLSHEAIDD